MKELKITNPRKSYLSYIELAVILTAVWIKSFFFYASTGLENYTFAISLASVCVFFLIYIVFLLATKKNPATIVIGLYFALCVLMFVDVMYYTYFSSLPGVIKLKLIKYLVGVTDSVGAVFNYKLLLFIADIPLVIVYLIFGRKKAAGALCIKKEQTVHFFKWTLPALCSVFIMVTSISVSAQGGYYQALQNELIYYHTADVVKAVLPFSKQTEFDILQYINDGDVNAQYFGAAQGMNLINIQVEALQDFVIGATYNGQEITPNLNALIAENSLYFDNYYWVVGGGGTSDAEFEVNNSLYAPAQEAAYDKFTELEYYGLPFLLKDNGYTGAYVFHGYTETFWNRNEAYPYQGFDEYISQNDYEQTDVIGLGLSDREFFKQSLSFIKTYEEPFYAFMITLSSHHPFAMPNEYMYLDLKEEHKGTLFGNYLESIHYVDKVIGEFIEDLKNCGLYDRTMITIYGDHYALNTQNDDGYMSDFLGKPYDREEIFNIPLIVHIPNSGITETISTTGGHLDYEPTILNLLGLRNDKAVMFGQDLVNSKTGHIYLQNHVPIGSFIDDEVLAVNSSTGLKVFDKFTMQELEPSKYLKKSQLARKTIDDCQQILEQDKILLDKWLH